MESVQSLFKVKMEVLLAGTMRWHTLRTSSRKPYLVSGGPWVMWPCSGRIHVMASPSRNERTPDPHNDAQLLDRRGRRLPLGCRMFFFGDDELEGEATVLDVSTNGCRAETSVELKIGMVLKLSVFLSDFKWPLRIDQAIVRWIDGQQFGLEFTSIRLAQRERLRNLIMRVRL